MCSHQPLLEILSNIHVSFDILLFFSIVNLTFLIILSLPDFVTFEYFHFIIIILKLLFHFKSRLSRIDVYGKTVTLCLV